jgi:hypothetical protein
MTEKVPTSLVGAAGEHYVLAQFLLRGFLAALTPRGAPLADILVHGDGTPVAQIQVKAWSGRHGHGWPSRSGVIGERAVDLALLVRCTSVALLRYDCGRLPV